MPEQYTESAKAAIRLAKQSAKKFHHSYVGTEHLLLGLVREQDGAAGVILRDFRVKAERLEELIEQLAADDGGVITADAEGFSPRAEGILRNADQEAEASGLELTGTEHILIALMKDVECVAARLLHTMEVNLQDLYVRLLDVMGVTDEKQRDLMKNTRAAGDSAQMDTANLDQYSRDLTDQAAEGKLDPIIGREKETERIIQVLSRRTKNNPCLIGEPGVGKTAIIEGLARRIVAGEVPDMLRNKRVVTLDMASMVAGSKYRGEFEERMKKVLDEVMLSTNVLLFIDELHTIIGAGGAEGALDASNIMKPFLSRGEIQLIGATTIDEYRKYIEKDPALERRFQPIMVEEPSVEDTVEILKGLRSAYEKHHGVVITDEFIEAAATLSKRYINDRYLPDKAIDLMDESCAKKQLGSWKMPKKAAEKSEEIAKLTGELEKALTEGDIEQASGIHAELEKLQKSYERDLRRVQGRNASNPPQLVADDVAATVAQWTGVPVARIAQSEGQKLLHLEDELHKRVIGQDEAVVAVARATKRGRAGLKDPKRPIGSFLFLGPTGVGKTELSKALAETVFGSEQSMIRVDMSEYMEKHSVSKLVGSPPGYVGYEEGGQLSEKVRRHPYSVILFDEIEKAHPDVFNILLQVLDEGHITDSQGRQVDFKNTILIMTSNAGASAIMSPKRLGFGAQDDVKGNYEHMKSGVMEEIKHLFRPEFLNRIDDIMVFHSLTRENIGEIVTLLMKELTKRCQEQMEFTFKAKPEVRDFIAKEGYDEKYGARPLKRAIQTKIEDPLSEEILAGNIQKGDTVTAVMKDEKTIAFRVRHPKTENA